MKRLLRLTSRCSGAGAAALPPPPHPAPAHSSHPFRYERNNAFLLHSVRNDEAAMKAAISNRDSEPKDEQISRGSSLSEISRHLGLRPSASPAKGLATAPSSPAAPSSAPPLGTRRPPGARVDLAVLSAAARPGDLDTPDHPKLLSPLAGQPVLAHVLRQLRRGGIRRVVLVIGNRGAQVGVGGARWGPGCV
eukprot:scaffold19655_cov104-Isochrysis_galbana.AAC.3